MGWLVRKISRARWKELEELESGAIAADAVTKDLKTEGNQLSLWTCENPGESSELRKAILALTARTTEVPRCKASQTDPFFSLTSVPLW